MGVWNLEKQVPRSPRARAQAELLLQQDADVWLLTEVPADPLLDGHSVHAGASRPGEPDQVWSVIGLAKRKGGGMTAKQVEQAAALYEQGWSIAKIAARLDVKDSNRAAASRMQASFSVGPGTGHSEMVRCDVDYLNGVRQLDIPSLTRLRKCRSDGHPR